MPNILHEDLDSIIEDSTDEIKEFFSKLTKPLSNPCEDDPDDCRELRCPDETCQGILKTVFATLPLEVKCEKCNKIYVLRELFSIK